MNYIHMRNTQMMQLNLLLGVPSCGKLPTMQKRMGL